MSRPAVFLDRDGTVTREVGYINHVDRLELLPHSAAAIRRLNEAGVPVVLITNQAGVARGYFPIELVEKVHQRLSELLAAEGAHLDGIYFCPHVAEGKVSPYNIDCECRKPKTKMLEDAAQDLDLDLASSFAVGDKITDIEMIHRVGGRGVFVLTGYGKGDLEYRSHAWTERPDFTAEHLGAAVEWILKERGCDE
ncbi:MAG: D-glycero-alpha-D-manno-heptose-1,7-bisphosphate 7-phosphatase [Alphaproteobacteria bacterium]